jgi:hypothetical protein
MSCAAFTILGVYALAMHKDNPWLIRSSFVLAGVFVVIAIALAWRDEHSKLLAEIVKNSKPDFQMDVVRAVRLMRRSGKFESPSLLVSASVVNLVDAPSTILSISLFMDAPQKEPVSKAVIFGSQTLTIETDRRIYDTNFSSEVWTKDRREEAVVDMSPLVKKQTLERGKHVEGWLLFESLPWDLLSVTELSFSLSVKDAFGSEHNTQPFNLALERGDWR